MGEIGKVIEVIEDKIKIELERTEACAKCRACSVGMDSKTMTIECANLCDAKIGDKVEIMLEENNFLLAVLIMYGIPFAAFVVGVFGGYFGSKHLGIANNEAIGCIFGLILVSLVYFWINSKEDLWKRKNFIPKAVKLNEKAAVSDSEV